MEIQPKRFDMTVRIAREKNSAPVPTSLALDSPPRSRLPVAFTAPAPFPMSVPLASQPVTGESSREAGREAPPSYESAPYCPEIGTWGVWKLEPIGIYYPAQIASVNHENETVSLALLPGMWPETETQTLDSHTLERSWKECAAALGEAGHDPDLLAPEEVNILAILHINSLNMFYTGCTNFLALVVGQYLAGGP